MRDQHASRCRERQLASATCFGRRTSDAFLFPNCCFIPCRFSPALILFSPFYFRVLQCARPRCDVAFQFRCLSLSRASLQGLRPSRRPQARKFLRFIHGAQVSRHGALQLLYLPTLHHISLYKTRSSHHHQDHGTHRPMGLLSPNLALSRHSALLIPSRSLISVLRHHTHSMRLGSRVPTSLRPR